MESTTDGYSEVGRKGGEREKVLYELALKQGERRFGSLCKHEVVKNGRCVNCLRRVRSRSQADTKS